MSKVMTFVDDVVKAIKAAVHGAAAPLHAPIFEGNEWIYLRDCLDTTFVSSVGQYVDKFERGLADFTGARRAVAVVNGTAGLQVALKLAEIELGDEVLVPALTFAGTANAVAYIGAIPHFVDSEEATLGMGGASLRDWLNHIGEPTANGLRNRETGRRIKCIVPMHTFGHPVDLESIIAIARDFNLVVVEDAAEALGSYYQGQHAGTFGKMGVLSFNGNKIITTGGGGALLCNDDKLADYAKHITTTAKRPHRWEYWHDEVGYNFRMPNINAALGCAQLEKISDFLASKRRLHHKYAEFFERVRGVQLFREPSNCHSNYWLQTLILAESMSDKRDEILSSTNDAGFATRPAWQLLNSLPHYRDCPRAPLPVAESLLRRIINIPSSSGLA